MEVNNISNSIKVEQVQLQAQQVHQGTIVNAYARSNGDGDVGVWFELSDGSRWVTSGFGRPKALQWHLGDVITVTSEGKAVNETRNSSDSVRKTDWVPPNLGT